MHEFDQVWLQCLGFQCIDYLCFRDLINLTRAYPVVCDSLFHGSILSKRFFKRFWLQLVFSSHDYVQTHDCYELLYKQFTQWQHTPSTCLLPLPMEGFYPVEPYLAWRITSLFLYHSDGQMELIFYANPQMHSLLDIDLPMDRLSFTTITVDDRGEFIAYSEDDWSKSQSVKKQDILALVFELLMMPWYRISLYGVEFDVDMMLFPPHSKHKIQNFPGEYLSISNNP